MDVVSLPCFLKDRCFFPNQRKPEVVRPPPRWLTSLTSRKLCRFQSFQGLSLLAFLLLPLLPDQLHEAHWPGRPNSEVGKSGSHPGKWFGRPIPELKHLKDSPPNPQLVWFFSPQNWIKAIIVVDFYEGTMILGGLPFNSHDFARI